MYIIGENIHIISEKVKLALKERDAKFFQELAVAQIEGGAQALDINLGPRKKDWEEVFPWMVENIEAVTDVPLSFDSTNLMGIEAGLKKVTKAQAIINSTSAEPERLEKVPLLAKEYDAKLIALTMGSSGIPISADDRVTIALEQLIPRMLEIDYPNYYTDWPNTEGRAILWHSYDSTAGALSGNVDIDLIDATTLAKVTDIAVVSAVDNGKSTARLS